MDPMTRDPGGSYEAPFGEEQASDMDELPRYLAQRFMEMESRSAGQALHPVILELSDLIDHDPVLRMYVTEMIAQVPEPFRAYHPADIPQLLRHLNAALTMAPE